MKAIPVAAIALCASTATLRADFKICNRMSYVVDAAIAIDDKGNVATRGWFRVAPGQCQSIAPGALQADRYFLHARALSIYGAPPAAQSNQNMFCIAEGNFIIAAAKACRSDQKPAAFVEVKPSVNEDSQITYLGEAAQYDDEQARFAAIQRLLSIGGYDATPIDGVEGPKSTAALDRFLKEHALNAASTQSPGFLDTLLAAIQKPSENGLTWCNDTPYRVLASLALDDGKTINARGWYRLDAGQCLHPDMNTQAKRIFSYAEAVDPSGRVIVANNKPMQWGGAQQLCTRENKFDISDHNDCAARGLKSIGFAPVTLSPSGGATLRFK